jgi:murein L,D-transpeptidase YafK
MSRLLAFIFLCMIMPQISFRETQRQHQRVNTAYLEKQTVINSYFLSKKLNPKNFSLFIRAFKKEMKLEVWVKPKAERKFILLHSYDFCNTSGTLGPKRKEGDLQIPEGVYHINHFNPASDFHLSLGINYPNESDKILSDQKHPGGAIYIHGNCVTVGCIPITDDKIKELYIMAVEARNSGQEKIPVHIFPSRLTESGLNDLKLNIGASPALARFWENLKNVYDDFEKSHDLRTMRVNRSGEYFF